MPFYNQAQKILAGYNKPRFDHYISKKQKKKQLSTYVFSVMYCD